MELSCTTNTGPNDVPPGAELYEGFLIIPEEAKLPAFVQPGRGVGLGEGELLVFTALDGLLNQLPYPILFPSYVPTDLQFIEAQMARHSPSKQIRSITLFFSGLNSDAEMSDPRLLLFIDLHPPRPAPFVVPRNGDDQLVYPQKVSFTPSLGLERVDATSDFTQWFDKDMLYTLVTRPSDTESVAKSLAYVSPS